MYMAVVEWSVLQMSVRGSCFIILCKYFFFIFGDFSRVVLLLKTVLKYPTLIVKLSIYPFNLVSFFICFEASVASVMFIIIRLLLLSP